MNTSFSKIRHIQESNRQLERRLLNEKIGDKLTPESLNSHKAQDTKKTASFLNSHYNIKLNAATTGSWTDKDYNDTLVRYFTENNIKYGVCKKGDGYCSDDSEGEVYTQDRNFSTMVKGFEPSKVNTQSNPQDKINTTNDKIYDYKLSNGKYYYSKKGLNNWIEATGKSLEAIKTKIKF